MERKKSKRVNGHIGYYPRCGSRYPESHLQKERVSINSGPRRRVTRIRNSGWETPPETSPRDKAHCVRRDAEPQLHRPGGSGAGCSGGGRPPRGSRLPAPPANGRFGPGGAGGQRPALPAAHGGWARAGPRRTSGGSAGRRGPGASALRGSPKFRREVGAPPWRCLSAVGPAGRAADPPRHLAPNFPSQPTWGRGSRLLLPLSAAGRPAAAYTTPSLSASRPASLPAPRPAAASAAASAAAPRSSLHPPPAPAAALQTAARPRRSPPLTLPGALCRAVSRARPRGAACSHTKTGSGGRALVPLGAGDERAGGRRAHPALGSASRAGIYHATAGYGFRVIPCREAGGRGAGSRCPVPPGGRGRGAARRRGVCVTHRLRRRGNSRGCGRRDEGWRWALKEGHGSPRDRERRAADAAEVRAIFKTRAANAAEVAAATASPQSSTDPGWRSSL